LSEGLFKNFKIYNGFYTGVEEAVKNTKLGDPFKERTNIL